MSNRRFELLKDLPCGEKRLDVYERLNDERYYYNIRLWPDKVCRIETEYVENNPVWFKEIKDTEESSGGQMPYFIGGIDPFRLDRGDFVNDGKCITFKKSNDGRILVAHYRTDTAKDQIEQIKKFYDNAYIMKENGGDTEESSKPFVWDDIAVASFSYFFLNNHDNEKYSGQNLMDEWKRLYHQCKYCLAWTIQPDEDCYIAPSKQQASNDGLKSHMESKVGIEFNMERGKDWEIVAFRMDDAFPINKNDDETFGDKHYQIFEKDLLASSRHKIFSVKRPSDGEVFSVGDKIINDGVEEIKGFGMSGNKEIMVIYTVRQPGLSGVGITFSKAVQKVK